MTTNFAQWTRDGGPAAVVMREYLLPVEGEDGVLFPPTFAASEDKTFKGGYNIDEFPDATNICAIDTVGSQANRIEPLFMGSDYRELVPQIVITAGERAVNLLEAGHRAGDAIARCSSLKDELHAAFKAVLRGDAGPLAKIAPTSLLFGAWDSRDTQAKLPRILASTIRATNVRRLHRSAQYVPAANYVQDALLEDPPDKKTADRYSERGFLHVPASWTHGGIIVKGEIRRDVTLHLAGLRLLASGDRTDDLRQYVLGLALVAFTSSPSGYLRQGCHLVPDPARPRVVKLVHHDGRREDAVLTHDAAFRHARAAAAAFGVGASRTEPFLIDNAKLDVADEGAAKKAAANETGEAKKARGGAKKK